MKLRVILFAGFALLGMIGDVHAAPAPEYINYQGVLRDDTGLPLDGEFDMVFRLYNDPSAGDLLLTDSHNVPDAVQVTDGLFGTHVGGGDLTSGAYSTLAQLVAGESEVWLEVSIWNSGETTWEVLSPRIRIVSAAYALSASSAEGALGDFNVAGNVNVSGTTESAGGFRFSDGSTQTTSALRDVCTELTGTAFCDLEGAIHETAWANLATVLDGGDGLGRFSSLAIGADGAPVVSYDDPSNDSLKVAKCANPQCTSAVVSTVDADHPWLGNSIAIGDDGNPVISYSYKVAKCMDPACTSATVNTLPGTPAASETTIAIGDDGNPVIAFTNVHSSTAALLMVAVCADPACASATLVTAASSALTRAPALTIGADGNPIFSYYEVTGTHPDQTYTLSAQQCLDPACASLGPVQPLDPAGNHSSHISHTSIAIGLDGYPVIAYLADGTSGNDLKVTKCTDLGCSSAGAVISTPQSAGNAGYYNSIAIGTDGNPVISYAPGSVQLAMAWCSDPSCTTGTLQGYNPVSDPTSYPSWERWIAIGTDGRPVIAYHGLNDFVRIVTGVERDYNGGSWGATAAAERSTLPAQRHSVGGADPPHEGVAVARWDYAQSVPRGQTVHGFPIRGEGEDCLDDSRSAAMVLATLEPVSETVEEGDVLVIDTERPGLLSLSSVPSDKTVFGIVAPMPPGGQDVGSIERSRDAADRRVQVVVSGVAVCKVDAGYGPIRPGDLLTTSFTAGHAMLATDPRSGTIVGKALEPLEVGTGLIRILVMLR